MPAKQIFFWAKIGITMVFLAFQPAFSQSNGLPEDILNIIRENGWDKDYAIDPYLKPAYLEADFNGDKSMDIAILINEKSTKKNGILIIHGKTYDHFILGAGKDPGNGKDDLDWMGRWSLYRKKLAYETVYDQRTGEVLEQIEIKLKRPTIYIEKLEGNSVVDSGMVYWNGSHYTWIHRAQ